MTLATESDESVGLDVGGGAEAEILCSVDVVADVDVVVIAAAMCVAVGGVGIGEIVGVLIGSGWGASEGRCRNGFEYVSGE